MKLKPMLLSLLCGAVLFSGCSQHAYTPTVDTDNTTTTTSVSVTTTTADLLYATKIPTTTKPSSAWEGVTYTKPEEGKIYSHSEYDLYNEFQTNFWELCQYAEEPELFRLQMEAYSVEKARKWEEDIRQEKGLTVLDFIRLGNLTKADVIQCFENKVKEAQKNGRSEEDARRAGYFSYEEIDVLFSGDERQIKQTFKSPMAVLSEDNVLYPFRWFMEHPVEDWVAAGIKPSDMTGTVAYWEYFFHPQDLKNRGLRQKLDVFLG